jgi:transposase
MAKTLSDDLRKRVVEAVNGGQCCRSAAEQFNISVATVIRWVERYRLSGSWAAKKRGRPEGRSPLDGHSDDILALLEKKADITLEEIVVYLRKTYGLETSKSSVDRFLTRSSVTFKKGKRTPVSR